MGSLVRLMTGNVRLISIIYRYRNTTGYRYVAWYSFPRVCHKLIFYIILVVLRLSDIVGRRTLSDTKKKSLFILLVYAFTYYTMLIRAHILLYPSAVCRLVLEYARIIASSVSSGIGEVGAVMIASWPEHQELNIMSACC